MSASFFLRVSPEVLLAARRERERRVKRSESGAKKQTALPGEQGGDAAGRKNGLLQTATLAAIS